MYTKWLCLLQHTLCVNRFLWSMCLLNTAATRKHKTLIYQHHQRLKDRSYTLFNNKKHQRIKNLNNNAEIHFIFGNLLIKPQTLFNYLVILDQKETKRKHSDHAALCDCRST